MNESYGIAGVRARSSSLVCFACVALAAGCSKSEAALSQPAPVASQHVGGARAEGEQYIAEIKTEGVAKAGGPGAVLVTLVSKGVYHTNPEYPYKFQLTDPAPDGVTYPKPVLQRADGTYEEKRASFRIPFVASKAGTVKVGGKLFMSLCSEANCIIDRVPLEVDVDVK